MMLLQDFIYICDAYHYSYNLHRRYSLTAYRYHRHHHHDHNVILTYLQSSRDNNNLDDLMLDTNNLDESEQKRLKYLQRINADASSILRSNGINYIDDNNDDKSDNDEMFDKPVEDTQWTGQSTSERSMISTRDYRDVLQRPFLAFLDFTVLLFFAIIGKLVGR